MPWTETIDSRAGDPPRYRMIQPADAVNVTIRVREPMVVDVRFSGTVFGGAASLMLHPDTIARFPADVPPRYGAYTYTMRAGSTVTIRRAARSTSWMLTFDGEVRERIGTSGPEQIYLSARPGAE
jgi:redox-sensitive bicupin YhaK (pirin superfamily)